MTYAILVQVPDALADRSNETGLTENGFLSISAALSSLGVAVCDVRAS